MPFAGNEIEVTTPFITFSFNLPSFTKKRTQQSDVPLAADTYNCGIGQPVPLNSKLYTPSAHPVSSEALH